jgi:hypothetical protein
MSERGSFVTEFIYCEHCLHGAKQVLAVDTRQLVGHVLPNMPIIAGRVRSIYPEGELDYMAQEIIPQLESVLCHKIRIVVIGETLYEIWLVGEGDSEVSARAGAPRAEAQTG